MIKKMDLEFIFGQIIDFLSVFGKMENKMGLENILKKMRLNMEFGKMEKGKNGLEMKKNLQIVWTPEMKNMLLFFNGVEVNLKTIWKLKVMMMKIMKIIMNIYHQKRKKEIKIMMINLLYNIWFNFINIFLFIFVH